MSLRRRICARLATEASELPAAWFRKLDREHASMAAHSVRTVLTPEVERRVAERLAEDERRAALWFEPLDEERRRRV
jgi:hypothetical protein